MTKHNSTNQVCNTFIVYTKKVPEGKWLSLKLQFVMCKFILLATAQVIVYSTVN